MRNLEPGRTAADRLRNHSEDFSQRHILSSENVTLADAALLGRREMALGYIVDMDDVETGIDKGGHLAACGLYDEAPGRRRLDIARPHGGGRIDDHNRQPALPCKLPSHFFGGVFRALVGT